MKKRLAALVLAVGLLLAGLPALADGWILEAETLLWGSPEDKWHNVALAVEQLNGTAIRYGETFSFNEAVGPRTREAGYLSAINGRGVEVVGGGVSQLATTLYLAVRDCAYFVLDEYETYNERFAEWYVEDGSDAIITDYKAGKDFSFTSWYDGTIYISAWVDEYFVYCSLFADGGQSNAAAVASTPLFGSENKRNNIWLASEAIYGTTLGTGEAFSFNEIVGPRSKRAGYLTALNGRGAKVIGGGVAQVASTVYLAVKELDCVQIDPVATYGERFVGGYVLDSADAIITDYNAGTDFSFTYWGDGELIILVFEENDRLICEVFED